MNVQERYASWLENATGDADVAQELQAIRGCDGRIEDAFYRDLAFGTGGLRGVIGAGTNRMNIYTVAKASQGLADYVVKHFTPEARSVAVSYDSRIKSDLFARITAEVFVANGIRVHIYPELMPTPCLSFAVRKLNCDAGVMVTASHNPSKYNGYKVYGADGCQITTEAAEEILAEIEKLDIFADVKRENYDAALADGRISLIGEDVYTAFVSEVKKQSVLDDSTPVDRNVAIVYTPLNGTGLKPVLRTLRETDFTNITVVKEQEQPDGHFPTCPYPNPEIREAMETGLALCRKVKPDLLLGTDPDCDRMGVAVPEGDDYRLITGNEMGVLLLDYICRRRLETGAMPEKPVAVTTIVSTDMAQPIANHYGVELRRVLTGFKFIGEQIAQLESAGEIDRYIFGFEESYGYLSGGHVRDKDAVNASMLCCEMTAWYKSKGMTLAQAMDALYETYGFYRNDLASFTFEGSEGMQKMAAIMEHLRANPPKMLDGKTVETVVDYQTGVNGLPNSNVLEFQTNSAKVLVRPSGTEPKVKVYLSARASNMDAAANMNQRILSELSEDYLK